MDLYSHLPFGQFLIIDYSLTLLTFITAHKLLNEGGNTSKSTRFLTSAILRFRARIFVVMITLATLVSFRAEAPRVIPRFREVLFYDFIMLFLNVWLYKCLAFTNSNQNATEKAVHMDKIPSRHANTFVDLEGGFDDPEEDKIESEMDYFGEKFLLLQTCKLL